MMGPSLKGVATQSPAGVGIFLAGGNRLEIVPVDDTAARMVLRLTEVMQLTARPQGQPRAGSGEPGDPQLHQVPRLIVTSDGAGLNQPRVVTSSSCPEVEDEGRAIRQTRFNLGRGIVSQDGETTIMFLSPPRDEVAMATRLIQLSLLIQLHTQRRGGVLLHAALASKDGNGVIMAGPGESGKTTSSQRLRPPWRSLSDDATLVVRDNPGQYWAHPWPTWSKFVHGGEGGTWDVQEAVRLRGIFFLIKSDEDRAERVEKGEAVCLLDASAGQASTLVERLIHGHDQRALRLERFNNVCSVAQSVPCYMLRQSLDGEFWREIERVLE